MICSVQRGANYNVYEVKEENVLVCLPLHQRKQAENLHKDPTIHTLARVENNILEQIQYVCPVGAGETIKHVPLLRKQCQRTQWSQR